MKENLHDKNILLRAQGCLLGQLAGDALGSLVEFRTPEDIRCQYPKGVRELSDGGTWNTVAGQPTDDSEMALLLARMLADQGRYDPDEAKKAYVFWLDSGPFDCGHTIARGLRGRPDPDSQANGAMMRISPLGIFGALLGSVYGLNALPGQWRDALLNCRPAASSPHVRHPRPECFWPMDALEIARQLLLPDIQRKPLK